MSESTYTYNIVKNDGEDTSVTVFISATGESYTASQDQPKFKAIVGALLTDAPLADIEGLFDLTKPLSEAFARLSDRVTIEHGNVYFDGDVQEGPVVNTIVRFFNEGNDSFKPLVNFLDLIGQNPNEHSRKNLSDWLANESFSLDDDGFIIAYKGVYQHGVDEATGLTTYAPSRVGPNVFVNDVAIPANGKAVQKVGDVVSMPRSAVEFDPKVACSKGLHIGTWGYASTFCSHTLLVRINPRDVVSVPTDCGGQKMRTCRYEIIGENVNAENDSLYHPVSVPAPAEPDPEPVIEDEQAEVAPEPIEANAVPVQADYAEYRAKDFKKLSRDALRAIAKAWKTASGGKVVAKGNSKDDLAKSLAKQAGNIRWNRKRGQGFQG